MAKDFYFQMPVIHVMFKLQKIQNMAARIITGLDEWTPSAPFVKDSRLEKYRQELPITVLNQGRVRHGSI